MSSNAIAGMCRKLSYHIVVGERVSSCLPEPVIASIASRTRQRLGPADLVREIRRHPRVDNIVYVTFGEVQTSKGPERVPALVHMSKEVRFPLDNLAGLFRGKAVSFRCLGSSFEADSARLLLLSPTLRSVPQETLSDPVGLVDWLVNNRQVIGQECDGEDLSLVYLVQALMVKGRIPLEQVYHWLAGGRDLYDRSPTLQSVPEEKLGDPIELIDWLHENRDAIRVEASEEDSLALVSLIKALQAAKRIPFEQSYHRLAGARDLYDRSPILQAIPQERLEDPIELVDWLHRNRGAIQAEASEKDSLALVSLIEALQAAKIIPFSKRYNYLAGGRDFYDNNPVLHDGEPILDDMREIIEFIDARINRLLRSGGKKGRVSFSYVIDALVAARRIGPSVNIRILALEAGAADYARKFESLISARIQTAVKGYLQTLAGQRQGLCFSPRRNHAWIRSKFFNRSFPRLDGKGWLSKAYANAIIKWARRFYGNREAARVFLLSLDLG